MMMCFCMFYIDINMVHLLGEDEGVAVVGQMVSWVDKIAGSG